MSIISYCLFISTDICSYHPSSKKPFIATENYHKILQLERVQIQQIVRRPTTKHESTLTLPNLWLKECQEKAESMLQSGCQEVCCGTDSFRNVYKNNLLQLTT